jgi:hypothetical protein
MDVFFRVIFRIGVDFFLDFDGEIEDAADGLDIRVR